MTTLVLVLLWILGMGLTLVAIGRLRQTLEALIDLTIQADVENRILHTAGRRFLAGEIRKLGEPEPDAPEPEHTGTC